MQVLLLTQSHDAYPAFEGMRFAQELRRQGHEIEVLTGYSNYSGAEAHDGCRLCPFERSVVDGIRVTRVLRHCCYESPGRKWALSCFFAAAATLASLVSRRPDVAYIYGPPGIMAVPAVALCLLRGVPLVYDVQDPWPTTPASTESISYPRAKDSVGRFMLAVYTRAHHVVVPTEVLKRRLHERGVSELKLTAIPKWAREPSIPVTDPDAAPGGFGINTAFAVVLADTAHRYQVVNTVIEAASLLRAWPVKFVLIAGDAEVERLRGRVAQLLLDNVQLLSEQPASDLSEVLAAADALVVHLKDGQFCVIAVPSKTMAQMLVAEPAFLKAAELAEESRVGHTFRPESPDALADAVFDLMALSSAERPAMGTNGRKDHRREFWVAMGSARLATVLERAARSRQPYSRIKRALDAVGAAVALTVFLVPMGALAVAIRVKLGSPVIFRQVRPGRHGAPFTIWKFRTMTEAVDEAGEPLPDSRRLTSFGTFLRLTSLDELPELLNVLRGEMSLVGPRPLLIRYTEFFTDEERRRLDVRPGITGLAQVHGRNLVTWDERLALDVEYVNRASPWLDLRIMAETVRGVFMRSGVVADPESMMRNLDDERRDRDRSGAAS